jgi:hypothetical protein
MLCPTFYVRVVPEADLLIRHTLTLNAYEDDSALDLGSARVMSAPSSYALAVVSFKATSTRCR